MVVAGRATGRGEVFGALLVGALDLEPLPLDDEDDEDEDVEREEVVGCEAGRAFGRGELDGADDLDDDPPPLPEPDLSKKTTGLISLFRNIYVIRFLRVMF